MIKHTKTSELKMGFLKTLTISLVLLMVNYSCVQNINSSSSDKQIYEKVSFDTSTPAGLRLFNAYNVIKRNCISCHSATMNLTTDSAWINSGYIVPGTPTSSILYCRTKDSGCGAEDMPKDGSIGSDEVNTLKVWIENL